MIKKYILVLLFIFSSAILMGSNCQKSKQEPISTPAPEPTPTNTTPVTKPLIFTPEKLIAAVEKNSVYIEYNENLSTQELLAFDIKTKEITNIFGVAFELNFDAAIISFKEINKGDLLGDDDKAIYHAGYEYNSNNKLLVGVTRKGRDDNKNILRGVDTSGTILTLKFTRGSLGSTLFKFSNKDARDDANKSIPNVIWYEGKLDIF